jgi:hypothetical protein
VLTLPEKFYKNIWDRFVDEQSPEDVHQMIIDHNELRPKGHLREDCLLREKSMEACGKMGFDPDEGHDVKHLDFLAEACLRRVAHEVLENLYSQSPAPRGM